MTKRVDKHNYYLDMAQTVLERATCLRRKYGAVIVKNDEVIATGYNGAPRGRENCTDLDFCAREKLNIKQGQNYELCRSVHAEQNAMISASRKEMLGGTIYLAGEMFKDGSWIELIDAEPCPICFRMIKNSGIKKIVSKGVEIDL